MCHLHTWRCDLNIRALGLSRTDIYITFTCKFTSANGQGIDDWSHGCNMMHKNIGALFWLPSRCLGTMEYFNFVTKCRFFCELPAWRRLPVEGQCVAIVLSLYLTITGWTNLSLVYAILIKQCLKYWDDLINNYYMYIVHTLLL